MEETSTTKSFNEEDETNPLDLDFDDQSQVIEKSVEVPKKSSKTKNSRITSLEQRFRMTL